MAPSRKAPAKSSAASKSKAVVGTLKQRTAAAAKTTPRLSKPSGAKAKITTVKRSAAADAKTRRAASASATRTGRFRSRSPLKPPSKFRAPTKTGKPKKTAAVKKAATLKPAKIRLLGTKKTKASIAKRGKPLVRKAYRRLTMIRADDGFRDFIRSLVLGKHSTTV